jgi:hypothetical protein
MSPKDRELLRRARLEDMKQNIAEERAREAWAAMPMPAWSYGFKQASPSPDLNARNPTMDTED